MVNEYASDYQFGERRKRHDSKREVMNDLYFDTHWHSLKLPDNLHPFGPGRQMLEADLVPLAIDDLFRDPRNRKKTSVGRHPHDISKGGSLVIMNVSIMRKKSRPALEVRGCIENHLFRGVHHYRVCAVHSAPFAT